jgi:hypothetical protein
VSFALAGVIRNALGLDRLRSGRHAPYQNWLARSTAGRQRSTPRIIAGERAVPVGGRPQASAPLGRRMPGSRRLAILRDRRWCRPNGCSAASEC